MQVGSFKRRKPPCSNEPGVCSWLVTCAACGFDVAARVAGTLIWALGRPRGGLLAARGGASRYGRAQPQGQGPPLRALGPELLHEGFYRVHHHLHRNSCQQQTGNAG